MATRRNVLDALLLAHRLLDHRGVISLSHERQRVELQRLIDETDERGTDD